MSETVKEHFHLALGDIDIFRNVKTFTEKIRRMVAINGEQRHSSLLEATSSHIVLLSFLIKLRWVVAVETKDQIIGFLFVFGACQGGIHAHKMLKLHTSLDIWYIAVEDSGSKSVKII